MSGTVWFIDRCLGGKVLAGAMRAAGAMVEVHDSHFAQDARDEDWLPEVGRRRWYLITRDERIRWRAAERAALVNAQVGAFFVSAGGMTGPAIAEVIAKVLPKMTRLTEKLVRPFIVTISPSGVLNVKLGERRGGRRK